MEYKYPVAKPCLKGNELQYVTEAIKKESISSQGDYIKKFERAFADWNGVNYGVACSSGTNALVLALRALNIGPGDEVIVPEFTMIASAWAVTYIGATPVFVDCKDDLNIDENLIEEKITPSTKAIMPVHIYGRKCNMDKIMNIAYNYNLFVVEDSAEAHGVKPTGDIACFSLYANKVITSGEGGICVTNSERLAKQMEHLRAMGFTPTHDFIHKKISYNFRMTNMQGAIALAQLERIEEFLKKRKQIESWYDENLKNIPGIKLMPKRDILWMYDLQTKKATELQKGLEERGIETRQLFKPMSRQPMYYNENWKNLKAAAYGYNGFYLPTYFELTEQDIKYICEIVKELMTKENAKFGENAKLIPAELYKQILENIPIPCVDIVIFHKGKVLLVYRKEEPAKGKWWIPGGRIHKNEKLTDAVIRKVKEETNLKVRIEKQIGGYEYMSDRGIYNDLKTGTNAIAVNYLVTLLEEQEIKIDNTSLNYRWIDKIEEDLDPYIKTILKDSGVFD